MGSGFEPLFYFVEFILKYFIYKPYVEITVFDK